MQNVQLTHDAHQGSGRKYPLCYLAHDIDTPMNVGSFFRISDALGVCRIYLSGSSAVPPNPKIRKTSRACEKYVAYEYQPDPMTVVATLKAQGYRIVCLEITSTSVAIDRFEVSAGERICLVLGSESEGVCQSLLDVCDATVHIPMLGHNSSMNVASACSIATWELIRRMNQ
jgi:tRNA G18 (ribose-2'-O)-methylase SpoU